MYCSLRRVEEKELKVKNEQEEEKDEDELKVEPDQRILNQGGINPGCGALKLLLLWFLKDFTKVQLL